MRNENMNVIKQFIEGCFTNCFILNNIDLIEEDMIYSLAKTSNNIIFDEIEEELIIDLENKGVNAVISYM